MTGLSRSDFTKHIQPFNFLFQTKSYGLLQVDMTLIHILEDHLYLNNRSRPVVRTEEHLSRFSYIQVVVRRKAYRPPPQSHQTNNNLISSSGTIKKRISTAEAPTLIFKMDQSLPGTTLHFESKCLEKWKPGALSHLLALCVQRIATFPLDGRVYPTTDQILITIQEGMLEHVRCLFLLKQRLRHQKQQQQKQGTKVTKEQQHQKKNMLAYCDQERQNLVKEVFFHHHRAII